MRNYQRPAGSFSQEETQRIAYMNFFNQNKLRAFENCPKISLSCSGHYGNLAHWRLLQNHL